MTTLDQAERTHTFMGELCLPAKLETVPRLQQYIQFAIAYSKSKSTVDTVVSIDGSDTPYSAYWSIDEATSVGVIKTLREEKDREAIREALSCVEHLFRTLMKLPPVSELQGKLPGSEGTYYAACFLTLIFQEAVYHRRQSQIRPLLRNLQGAREKCALALDTIFPKHHSGASRLLTIWELLIKDNLRVVLAATKSKYAAIIRKQLEAISLAVMISPGSLIEYHARHAVVKRRFFNKASKKFESKDSHQVVRPSIETSGVPLTPQELTLAHGVNATLLRMHEPLASAVSTVGDKDLACISNKTGYVVSQLFKRTDAVNAVLKDRRRRVRDYIYASRMASSSSSSSSTMSSSLSTKKMNLGRQDPITPSEWSNAETLLLSNTAETKMFLTALGQVTITDPTIEKIQGWSIASYANDVVKLYMSSDSTFEVHDSGSVVETTEHEDDM